MSEQKFNPVTKRFYTDSTPAPAAIKGDRAGEAFASSEDLDDRAWDDEYAKSVGATGIAGAGKRSQPAFKTGLADYKAKKRAARIRAQIDNARKSREIAEKLGGEE